MKIKNMFYKEIDRDIKGVIKIGQDDDANVFQELDEYVVTRELNHHFSTFFDSYKKAINNYTDKMGVWISGFFGSGKSHFLKILSYLLENKEVEGKRAITFFDDKLTDPMVLADIKRSGEISADVILFNIDSKSDSDTKSDKELIVKVFNKVFNEMQGFSGSLPWLAELELQMVKEGTYDAFKEKFRESAGSSWEDSREDIYFEEDNIVTTLAETTRMSAEAARNWYHKAEENYALSVEKFANRVKEYIEAKGKEHHVIFLVDEVGQYIGDDSNLILNLQTVVEDMGTYCGGKAWVIVSSQQDIDTVTRVRGNDFSKIQARFNTRLSLSGANVDEVIKRRIIYKNETAAETLKMLFPEKEAILKNLITFTADTPEMKLYKTADDFVDVYPFIPYQFRLLQSVFTAIRQHGASGKHLAEGERSLLSAFQESAVKYMDEEIGILIPFSSFYETIETFLDHNIRTVIMHAEDNERLSPRDVEVLKALFLIKWVKEMPANLENLATLLVDHIDTDKIALKKEIEESLHRLRRETLIQKNGAEYIFLTHEEQDVNREIQNITVDVANIINTIGEEIFFNIYSEKKFRYNNRYHFDFNKVIDDRFLSTQRSEIGVKVITPYSDAGSDSSESAYKMMSARENSLIIKLPSETTVMDEMDDILKINTYLLRKGGTAALEAVEEIKARKSQEVAKRKERLKNLLIEAIADADLYVNSQKLDIKSKNPTERINSGLKILIDNLYSKLGYITEFVESPRDLHDILYSKDTSVKIFEDEEIPNKLALQEIKAYIDRNTERNIPVTIKSLLDYYTKAPYGWLQDDIRGLIVKLFKGQEIKLQLGGDYLHTADKEILNYITKKDYIERLLVKTRAESPKEHLKNAGNLIKELFNQSPPDNEDALASRFLELSAKELATIKELLVRYENNNYPGKDILIKGKELFEKITAIKDPMELFEQLYTLKEEFLDYEEDIRDVKSFFDNQRGAFDNAVAKLKIYEKNKAYIYDSAVMETVTKIENIINSPSPYSQIPQLPTLVDNFAGGFVKILEEECQPIKEVIESDWQKVMDDLEPREFKDDFESIFDDKFQTLLKKLNSTNDMVEAMAMKEESDRLKIKCLDEIEKEAAERAITEPPITAGEDETSPYDPKETVNITSSKIFPGTRYIRTEEDIEELLREIREKLTARLNEKTIIKLS